VFQSCGDRFQRVIGELREITVFDFNVIFWDFYGTRLCVKISILSGLSSIYLRYICRYVYADIDMLRYSFVGHIIYYEYLIVFIIVPLYVRRVSPRHVSPQG